MAGKANVDVDVLVPLSTLMAAFDDLIVMSLTGLTRDSLIDVVRRFEVLRRRMSAFDHRLIVELESRGVAKDLCSASTAKLLTQLLRLTPGEAAGRVRAAEVLGPRADCTGAPMPPAFAIVAAAQADGTVSSAHAAVITRTVRDLPAAVRGEYGDHVEADMVTHATRLHPDQLRKAAQRIVDHLDPDGTLSDEHDHQRRRGVVITCNRDGSGSISGRLAPDCLETLLAVTDSLAAPRPVDRFGRKDPRTAAQRTHDAIHDAARRLLRAPELADSGGIPATVLITVTVDQLISRAAAHIPADGFTSNDIAPDGTRRDGTGRGRVEPEGTGCNRTGPGGLEWFGLPVGPGRLAATGHGGLIGLDTALRIADQANIVTVVSGSNGRVLGTSSQSRIATKRQRLALAARDGGCSFPDCDTPPAWTETHHVREWSQGGKTTLDNLTLLYGYHHRKHKRTGWQCDMRAGLPYWIPPAYLDCERTPLHDHAHSVAS